MIRTLLSAVTVAAALAVSLAALAAPGPKIEDKPLPPITAAQRDGSVGNLRQIGLALHNHHDANGAMPANQLAKDGKPGLSWRVLLLPYLDEDKLYREFKLNEPWDSEHNSKLAERMPKIYAPVRGRAEKNQTFYQMFAGKGTMLGENGMGVRFAAVTDGTSNTFMVVEGARPVIWTKPDDLTWDGKEVPKLGGMFDGQFHALMGDGSVHRVPKGLDTETLRRCIGRHDGLVVDLIDAIKGARE